MLSDGECVGAGAGAAAGLLLVLLSAWVLRAGWRRWRRRRMQAVQPVDGFDRSDSAHNVTAGSSPLLNIFSAVSGVSREVRWERAWAGAAVTRGVVVRRARGGGGTRASL